MRKVWIKVWLICGMLDISYAAGTSLVLGRSPLAMLRGIASGPFGKAATEWGLAGSALGLAVHFALMADIVAAGFWLARKTPLGTIAPWKAGTFFGLGIFSVMYGLVLQLRFGTPFPDPDRLKLANELFPHVFLVGIPLFHLFRHRPGQANAAAFLSS